MAGELRMGFRDFDGDRQVVSYPTNFDTGDIVQSETDHAELQSALELWSGGKVDGVDTVVEVVPLSGGSSANVTAQSRSQLILEVKEVGTGKDYKYRLPFPNMLKAADGGANEPFIASGGLTVVNTAHADWATLKTAVDKQVLSPNGNLVTLQRASIEE